MLHRKELTALTIRHEGKRNKLYWDTATPPRATIGVGRNLTDNGLRDDEIMYLLNNDLEQAISDLASLIGSDLVFRLSPVRYCALVSWSFNLGRTKMAQFKNTLAAMRREDWASASNGLAKSLWARQVPNRANEIIYMVRHNRWMESPS